MCFYLHSSSLLILKILLNILQRSTSVDVRFLPNTNAKNCAWYLVLLTRICLLPCKIHYDCCPQDSFLFATPFKTTSSNEWLHLWLTFGLFLLVLSFKTKLLVKKNACTYGWLMDSFCFLCLSKLVRDGVDYHWRIFMCGKVIKMKIFLLFTCIGIGSSKIDIGTYIIVAPLISRTFLVEFC